MDTQVPETRQVKITGGAAADYHKVKRGGSRRQPKMQKGGDDAPGPQIPVNATNVAAVRRMVNSMKGGDVFSAGIFDGTSAPVAPAGPSTLPGSNPQDAMKLGPLPAVQANIQAGIVSPVAPSPSTPAVSLQTASSPSPPTSGQAGGKLTLVPSKKKSRSRLVLAPPATSRTKSSKLRETRKIRVQLTGLKKRLTKAKAIHKDSREKSIAEVRKILEEARLVKPAKDGKTVPDSVLRDIYKDYLLLRNRAL
jgi:hypothetical protein